METPLKAYRTKTGRTLEEVATILGVSISQASRVERFGTTELAMALKLSKLTGQPAHKFGLTDDAPTRRKAK